MRRRSVTTAKKTSYRGIWFKSKLEAAMYRQLLRHKIPCAYEKINFNIIEGFLFENDSYERFLNGRGDFKNRGRKRLNRSIYTPDFTPPQGQELKWVIECKGNMIKGFSVTWKLFKKYLHDKGMDTVLFMPRNEKDCREVARIIKQMYDGKEGEFKQSANHFY